MNDSMILLETEAFRLTLGADAAAESLVYKPTGEELLQNAEHLPLFSVTQERPYNNEVKLAHPNKRTTFPANRVRREGNRLIVGFSIAPYEAVIEVTEAPRYLAFRLADFIVHPEDYGSLNMTPPPVSEFRLMQLPLKPRKHFGAWLNVLWDDTAAVNVLAACPQTRIDSEERMNCRVLTADADSQIKLRGVTAALIVEHPDTLLDAIASLEEDYDLPRGVESRRSQYINRSAYWSANVNPDNVDEHIRYAKMGGFKMMLMYYTCFFKEAGGYFLNGDYDYLPAYPNGAEDVRKMLDKVRAAGIIPGIHFLQTHIGLKSRYVRGKADHRLHLTRHFTLSRPLGTDDDTVYVEENPENTVMADRCRVLDFGGELMTYESYVCEYPYHFCGVQRGAHETEVTSHPLGEIGGILDITEFGTSSVYLDQNSDLQDEIADKLGAVYAAGFRFVYFDGSEGTNAPFGYHVPNAQYRVWKKLSPSPLFCEGAAKAHFGWHFLSGGNAFDIFPPEVFKEKIAQHPAEEAPRMREDFTRLNFGWWGYWNPGTQADLVEYGTSRAAAWDCPVTIQTNLDAFRSHPRTDDIMEVMRRWEDVRENGWLDAEKKEQLKNLKQEHTLLIDENGNYELVPYTQIAGDQKAAEPLRAFLFERKGLRYVVFWHVSGSGTLSLPLRAADITVQKELSSAPIALEEQDGRVLIPIAGKQYLSSACSAEELRRAFADAVLL